MGGAVGVAIVSSRIAELTQIHHSYLAEFMTPYRHAISPQPDGGMAMHLLNGGLTMQASMIAYINAFLLLAILSIAMLPIVLLLRTGRQAPSHGLAAVVD